MMRTKEEILENFRQDNSEYWFRRFLLEVLCDIRDELKRGKT